MLLVRRFSLFGAFKRARARVCLLLAYGQRVKCRVYRTWRMSALFERSLGVTRFACFEVSNFVN